jgi:hypothetical protein
MEFAQLSKGRVVLSLRAVDQEMSPKGLERLIESVLGPFFKRESIQPATCGGRSGLAHPVRRAALQEVIVFGDAARAYVALVLGAQAEVDVLGDEIRQILGAIRSVPGY